MMKQASIPELLFNSDTNEKCLQPQYIHIINDIQTIDALCDERTIDPSAELEITQVKSPIILSETLPIVPLESDKQNVFPIDKTQKSKRKPKIPLKISLFSLEKDNDDDNDIPLNSTVFTYNGKDILINANELHGKEISRGHFGSVRLVNIKALPDMPLAVKHSNITMISEVKILKTISSGSCQYIVDYYCSLKKFNSNDLYICMEFMDISIKSFYQTMHVMNKIKTNDIEQFMKRVIHDVASGLFYLEIKELLHRDIKPENLLVNKNGIVKLCDFGLSRSFKSEITNEQFLGDVNYMPPNLNNSIQDDMWSLGISLFEILDGKNPFSIELPSNKCFIISEWQPNPSALNKLSTELQELILHLLKQQASERPRSYIDILDKPSICNLNQSPTNDELKFIRRIIEYSGLFSFEN